MSGVLAAGAMPSVLEKDVLARFSVSEKRILTVKRGVQCTGVDKLRQVISR